jgi:type I restriction enzyme S subunit
MSGPRLDDITTKIGSGATPRGGEKVYRSSGIALIRSQNVYNDGFHSDGLAFIGDEHAAELSHVEVKSGDVLLNITGDSVARVCQVPDDVLPARVNQHVAIIRPRKDALNSRFLRYFLVSPVTQAHLHVLASAGATRSALTKAMIEGLEIPRLPLHAQNAIAQILGSLDDKIELNRHMNATLEAMARAIFKSWFVDFDPVHAKSEGRRPFTMEAETAALFPSSFENRLKRVPIGWGKGSILKIARLLSGGTPKTDRKEYWNGSVPWASAADVSQARKTFLIDTERTITERGLEESATQMIPAFSTVVVARGATTGRMVLFGREMAMNQTCYALSSTTETPLFLYCLLRNEIEGLVHAAHGSIFDTITTTTFGGSEVILPPQPVMKNFETTVWPLFQRVLHNSVESETLAEIRDALLPKLISSEIRVKVAKTPTGERV